MLLFFVLNLILLGISSASVINAPAHAGKNDNDTIGVTLVDLDASDCNKRECNFGNLVAESVRYDYLVEHSTGIKVPDVLVLLQSKNFNGLIEKSTNLTQSHLLSGMSKNSALVIGKLKGSAIKSALEKSVEKYTQEQGSPDFLQVAGGLITFDFASEDGKRLKSAQFLCVDCNSFSEIKDTTSYDVVMTEDLSKATFSEQSFTLLESNDLDSVETYIKQRKIVYPSIDGRIILQNVENAPKGNKAVTLTTSTFLVWILVLLQKFLSTA